MNVGPAIPMPIPAGTAGTRASASSAWKTNCWNAVIPPPPYSFGQAGATQPRAASFLRQVSIASARSETSKPNPAARRAVFSSGGHSVWMKSLTSLRNAPSSGESLKSMSAAPVSGHLQMFRCAQLDASPLFSPQALDDGRDALAAADAHRLQAELDLPPLHLVEQRRHDPGAGRPDRMADRDAGAVDVHPVEVPLREAPLAGAGQDLGGERLVQLEQAHLSETRPGPLQRLLARR